MWTREQLKAVAEQRGDLHQSRKLDQAMLAHERSQGRTEENYPAEKAAKEFDKLAEALEREDLPTGGRMFAGLAEFSAKVLQRVQVKEHALVQQRQVQAVQQPLPVRAPVREPEPETKEEKGPLEDNDFIRKREARAEAKLREQEPENAKEKKKVKSRDKDREQEQGYE